VAVAPKRPPTVRDLLCHTAGYSYGTTGIEAADKAYAAADPFSKDKTLALMAASMAKVPLAFQPGSRWMYGVSTDLLGRVVEVASGLPFELLLEKRLFIPLDLPDTSFALDPGKVDRLAVVYSSDRNGNLKNAGFDDFRYSKKSKLPSGGGGLLSTIRDYTRFLQMIANGGELHGVRLMKPETVNLMTTNQLSEDAMPIAFGPLKRHGTGFGLGFSVKVGDTDWNPEAPLGEYGWGGLLSTHYWLSPEDELVIVTMEQTIPYDFLLENELKPLIYAALDQ
jgi:CubicO group peptidase (beta-lactamase class C family)